MSIECLRRTHCLCVYLDYGGNRFPLKHGHLYTRLQGVTSRITILMLATTKIQSITNIDFAIPFLEHKEWLHMNVHAFLYLLVSPVCLIPARARGKMKWGKHSACGTDRLLTVSKRTQHNLLRNFVFFYTTGKKVDHKNSNKKVIYSKDKRGY